jgi:LysM repeat protein
MSKTIPLRRFIGLFAFTLLLAACNLSYEPGLQREAIAQAPSATPEGGIVPTETIPPSTPLATLTPTRTLLPPPTFEPPTLTVAPTLTPTQTPTQEINLQVTIPGLHGAASPTPEADEPECEPRESWRLKHTVQTGDTLSRIAAMYGTYANEMAQANCLSDPNLISVGQQIRVPGDAPPATAYQCPPWEILTPMNGTLAVSGTGTLTFNWRGPRADRYLIRIWTPDGGKYERVIELRQNETINLSDLPLGGTYTWYVYPLDFNFQQIPCLEGGPYTFVKEAAPPTPTPPSR